jgi:hypothetical protein
MGIRCWQFIASPNKDLCYNYTVLAREELGLRSKGKKYVLHFGRPAHKRKAGGGNSSRDIEAESAAEKGESAKAQCLGAEMAWWAEAKEAAIEESLERVRIRGGIPFFCRTAPGSSNFCLFP